MKAGGKVTQLPHSGLPRGKMARPTALSGIVSVGTPLFTATLYAFTVLPTVEPTVLPTVGSMFYPNTCGFCKKSRRSPRRFEGKLKKAGGR